MLKPCRICLPGVTARGHYCIRHQPKQCSILRQKSPENYHQHVHHIANDPLQNGWPWMIYCSRMKIHHQPNSSWWWFEICFLWSSPFGGNNPIWRAHFSDELKPHEEYGKKNWATLGLLDMPSFGRFFLTNNLKDVSSWYQSNSLFSSLRLAGHWANWACSSHAECWVRGGGRGP